MAESATVAPATDKTTEPEITEPGVYADLPEADYHAHSALSSSGARKLLAPSCPAKFRWEQDHPEPPRRVFDFGRAAHQMTLGVGAEIVEIDADDYRTKAAREQRDEAQAAGLTPLLPAENAQVLAMAEALRGHPIAGKLFRPWNGGVPEQSLFWTDRQTGVPCRARIDWTLINTRGRLVIVEYKTARSAEPTLFAKDFHGFGYHVQGAFYRAGAKVLGLSENPRVVHVVQEKEPPYLVTVFEPDRDALRAGAQDMRLALQVFAHCQETGIWPSYIEDDAIAPLSLPAWAARQYDLGEIL